MTPTERRLMFRALVKKYPLGKGCPVNLGLLFGFLLMLTSTKIPYYKGPIFSFQNRIGKQPKYEIVRFSLLGWFAYQYHISTGETITSIQHQWKKYTHRKNKTNRGCSIPKYFLLSTKVLEWAEMSEDFQYALFNLEQVKNKNLNTLKELEDKVYDLLNSYLKDE